MNRRIIAVAAMGLLCLNGGALAAERADLAGTTIAGEAFSLAQARGRVVLVNFWATWCAPCRAEMPAFDAFYRQHQGEGLDLIAVSLDNGASTRHIAHATQDFAFRVARIADTQMPRSAIPGVLPTTRLYGRDGTLRYETDPRKPVLLDTAALERLVAPLLAEAPPAPR